MNPKLHTRAKVAAFERHGNRAAAAEARVELKLINAETFIRDLVDSAPPLSQSQRDRLAALLRTEEARAA